MIEGKRVLAVIPARGGSKGILRKNIRPVGGKPLLAYTVGAGRQSRYIDLLIVSTEDAEIASVSTELGVAVLPRPVDLAQDETPGVMPVLHAVASYPEYDYVVLLQPTSPLRETEDIDGALELCERMGVPACVSVCEAQENPFSFFKVGEHNTLSRFISGEAPKRRQDLPKLYLINGAVYVADSSWLRQTRSLVTDETVAYMMPYDRSLDIDTEDDLRFFEFVCQSKNK